MSKIKWYHHVIDLCFIVAMFTCYRYVAVPPDSVWLRVLVAVGRVVSFCVVRAFARWQGREQARKEIPSE